VPDVPLDGLQDQARVAAAETEGIGDGDPDAVGPGLVGDVAEIAFGIGIVEIDRRRDGAAFHGHKASQRFDGGGGREQVAGHALGRADRDGADGFAQDGLQDARLGRVAYAPWKSFRESDESRYVALTLPRVQARLPYGEKFHHVAEFDFDEFVDGESHEKYLWMSAAWAYAVRVTDAFARYGWMARTRGVHGGGKVEGLPVYGLPTDHGDIAMKCLTEIAMSDRRDFELSNIGFLPLLYSTDTNAAVFIGARSCQKPPKYVDQAANANAELLAEINVVLCLSRFVHYLKLMARDNIGAFVESMDCGRWLNKWIANYVVDPNGASDELKAKRPLSEARVEVRPVQSRQGGYELVAYLQPHFQFGCIALAMRIVAEIPKLAI